MLSFNIDPYQDFATAQAAFDAKVLETWTLDAAYLRAQAVQIEAAQKEEEACEEICLSCICACM